MLVVAALFMFKTIYMYWLMLNVTWALLQFTHEENKYTILVWQPIYRQPVYVGIYLHLAPAHSNYRLETKTHNLKSFCNEKKPARPLPWGHAQQLHIILLCLHACTNIRWKRTHLGFSPTDVSATSHVKFYYEGALIKPVLCH